MLGLGLEAKIVLFIKSGERGRVPWSTHQFGEIYPYNELVEMSRGVMLADYLPTQYLTIPKCNFIFIWLTHKTTENLITYDYMRSLGVPHIKPKCY